MRRLRSSGFWIPVVTAAVVCAIRPALIGWAVAGVIVAVIFAVRTASRRRGAAVASALIAGVMIVSCGGSSSVGPQPTIELSGHLAAVAAYEDARQAFKVSESLTIEEATIRQASASRLVPLGRPVRAEKEIVKAIRNTLNKSGWHTWLSTKAVRATYELTSAVHQHALFPGLTSNSLRLASPRFLGFIRGSQPTRLPPSGRPRGPEPLQIALSLDSSSGVTVSAPDLLIAATDPASTAEHAAGHREERQLRLSQEGTQLTYEARSTVFRHEMLSIIPSLTLWSGFKWLLLGIVALAGEEFRDTAKGVARRLLPSRRKSSADE